MEKIRVCHIALGDLWAGAEVQLATLVSQLVKYPELSVEAIIFNEGKLAEELRKTGIEVTVFDEKKLNSLTIFKKVTTYFKTHRIDILHTHKYKENILGGIAAGIAGDAAIVRTIHGSSEPFSGFEAVRMTTYQALDYLVNRFAVCKIVTVSMQMKDKLSRTYHSEKLVCIHNGMEMVEREGVGEIPLPGDQDEFLIGCVGRLMEVKGFDYFLKAAKIILTQNPGMNIKFVVVGDGPLRSALEGLALDLGVEKEVLFLGHRNDCMMLMEQMKIVVLSSLHEGIPMSLLEALSLAKPVVATRVGGIPEVIEDGVSGLLVNAQDEKAIADACTSFINHYDWAVTLGKNGKETVKEHFSAKANAEKIVQLYASLLSPAE